MTPTLAFLAGIVAAIAADATFLAEVAKVHVKLIKAAFTESPDLLIGGLTMADFTGSTGKAVSTATAQVFREAGTGDYILQLSEPAGGWHWQPSDNVNLPQTIYGYAVVDSTEATLIGTKAFTADERVALTMSGQGVDIPQVRLRLNVANFAPAA